eukprot:gene6045-10046_t
MLNNQQKYFKVEEQSTNTFSNNLERYIDKYNVDLTRNIGQNNLWLKKQNNIVSIAWDVFDFVLETYKIVLIRGVQQAIANNLSDSAHSFLEWIISRTDSILKLGKSGIFPLVVTTLMFKLIKSKPPKRLSYEDHLKNRIPDGNHYPVEPFQQNENIIWIPVRASNIPTKSNQTLLLE